ncbi:MAG: hypothetical protein ACYDEE_11025 [Ignavibacteriaceae bacterium]
MENDNRTPLQKLLRKDKSIQQIKLDYNSKNKSTIASKTSFPIGITKEEYSKVLEQYKLSSFRLSFPITFNLLRKQIDNFISKISSEYYFSLKLTRNNGIIGNEIKKWFSLKLINEIERDNHLRNILKGFEDLTVDDDNLEFRKKSIQLFLQDFLEEYYQLLKIFLALFISEQNQKGIIKELGIYRPYQPKGRAISSEIEMIYHSIPFIKDRLDAEHGDNKKGRSDLMAAVTETIKHLAKKNKKFDKYNIRRWYKRIYDSYRKYDPDKIFGNKIKTVINRLEEKDKERKTKKQ